MRNLFIIAFIFGIVIMFWLRPKKYSYIIPAYIPLGEKFDIGFDGIAEFSKKNKVITIVNPNNGPISREENEYYFEKLEEKIKRIQDNGGKVIGYVSTGYGERGQREVRKDIDLWRDKWNIDGIFLDEGMGSCSGNCERLIKKYQDYYEYIEDQIIVTNAGYIDEDYEKFLKDGVIMIIFENTYEKFISPTNYLNNMNLSKGKKGILLHTAPKDIDGKEIKKLYKKYDLNYIYLTSENWDTISLKLLKDL
ncbi:spherulation-specific family 4 protein [Psychrilyobacter atlanticus]|uniref:spherulation-specific family 4 protein n=1 Tax=Psychrilyobacter atlanticus TaxID=271091 RepID=UPI0004298638|nr:spherulation-specific family 4 protein [Psychrilyobacter atlanticus]